MISYEVLLQTPEYWVEITQNRLFLEVHKYMEKNNLTQTQLAEQLGVSKGYISQILKGNFNHTLKKLVEISLAVGVVPDIEFKNTQSFVEQSVRNVSNKEIKMSKESVFSILPKQEIVSNDKVIPLKSHSNQFFKVAK